LSVAHTCARCEQQEEGEHETPGQAGCSAVCRRGDGCPRRVRRQDQQQLVINERVQYRRQGWQAGRFADRRAQLGLRRRLARGVGSRDEHQRRRQPEPHELDLRPAHRAARGRQARARPGQRLQVLQRRQDLHAHHPPRREVLRRDGLHRPGGRRPHQQGPEVPVHLPADVAGQVRDGVGRRRGDQLHHRVRAVSLPRWAPGPSRW